jgi:uncharacterized membrane protein
MGTLRRLLRHLWLDADDARRALGEGAFDRLEARVRASEAGHSGQICLCVEASLPPSYLWRHLVRGEALAEVIRDRAITLFGKQRVWDTEANDGVLVYLLLAEHRIEIVADRALARTLAPSGWQAMVEQLCADCRQGRLEDALAHAVAQLDQLLRAHFPRDEETGGSLGDTGLPDRPLVR